MLRELGLGSNDLSISSAPKCTISLNTFLELTLFGLGIAVMNLPEALSLLILSVLQMNLSLYFDLTFLTDTDFSIYGLTWLASPRPS